MKNISITASAWELGRLDGVAALQIDAFDFSAKYVDDLVFAQVKCGRLASTEQARGDYVAGFNAAIASARVTARAKRMQRAIERIGTAGGGGHVEWAKVGHHDFAANPRGAVTLRAREGANEGHIVEVFLAQHLVMTVKLLGANLSDAWQYGAWLAEIFTRRSYERAARRAS